MKVIPKQKVYIVLKYENTQKFYIELGSYISMNNIRYTTGDPCRMRYSEDKLEIKINDKWHEVNRGSYILVNDNDNTEVLITDHIENYIEIV